MLWELDQPVSQLTGLLKHLGNLQVATEAKMWPPFAGALKEINLLHQSCRDSSIRGSEWVCTHTPQTCTHTHGHAHIHTHTPHAHAHTSHMPHTQAWTYTHTHPSFTCAHIYTPHMHMHTHHTEAHRAHTKHLSHALWNLPGWNGNGERESYGFNYPWLLEKMLNYDIVTCGLADRLFQFPSTWHTSRASFFLSFFWILECRPQNLPSVNGCV